MQNLPAGLPTYSTKNICTHQALRHPQQQLETGQIAKFTGRFKGYPTGVPKTMLRECPCCKTGTLITIEVSGKEGHPKIFIKNSSYTGKLTYG